jgi:TM2 domain-containing membrane protein YozV
LQHTTLEGEIMAKEEGPSRVACGIVALFLGAYGVHKFMLGQTGPGVIMLCITLLTCFIGSIVTGPIALIEAIMYLTKTDEEFYQTYVVEKKAWF